MVEKRYFQLKNSKLKELNVYVKYIQVECSVCGKSWGIALNENMDDVEEKKLVCLACLADSIY